MYKRQVWEVGGGNERAGDVCFRSDLQKVGENEMEVPGKGSSGGTGTGGVSAALGNDRRNNEAGGDGSPSVDEPKTGEIGVAGVYGIRLVE